MLATTILFATLCASPMFAAPIHIPGFGTKLIMSPELANAVHDIKFRPTASAFDMAILNKAAHAKVDLPKTHQDFQAMKDVRVAAKDHFA